MLGYVIDSSTLYITTKKKVALLLVASRSGDGNALSTWSELREGIIFRMQR